MKKIRTLVFVLFIFITIFLLYLNFTNSNTLIVSPIIKNNFPVYDHLLNKFQKVNTNNLLDISLNIMNNKIRVPKYSSNLKKTITNILKIKKLNHLYKNYKTKIIEINETKFYFQEKLQIIDPIAGIICVLVKV